MKLKAHILHSLTLSRGMTESIFEQFENDDDYFCQAHPKANHALWIAGHLGLADNMFAAKFRPDTDSKPDGYEELFWFGSELKDKSAYPPVAEVLAYMRDRRENLLKVIDEVTEEELNAEAPGPEERSAIAGAPNVGHLFLFAAYHEGVHTGQLTVCHRALGHDPLYKPQPAETS